MKIIAACPANCATGGPEAIHDLIARLKDRDGVDARIWYWGIKREDPVPEEYKR